MNLKAGFWRVGPESVKIFQCPGGKATCKGGGSNTSNNNLDDVYCKRQSRGPYCSICVRGFYKSDRFDKCHSCERAAKS